jgi:hypothetical protein
MRKYIYTIIIFVSLFCFTNNIKAIELESDLEYYNISYDFINDNEYYVTYNFKTGQDSHMYYYLLDDNVYLDTIEHNIDELELNNSSNYDMASMKFLLNKNKEYYIKYKGYFYGNGGNNYGICIKSLSKGTKKKNTCDNSYAASVYSFELQIHHPENIELNNDKINGLDNYIIEEEGETYLLLAGRKYERDRYYDATIYKKLILKSDIDREKLIKKILFYIVLFLLVVIITLFIYHDNKKKQQYISRKNV